MKRDDLSGWMALVKMISCFKRTGLRSGRTMMIDRLFGHPLGQGGFCRVCFFMFCS